MINIMDWIIEKLRLTDETEEEVYMEEDDETSEISWLGLMNRKKDTQFVLNQQAYFKKVAMYEDCKHLIDKYKSDTVCIFRISPTENSDAQGMMNYICGGIYALDGTVHNIGENVFMAVHSDDKIEKKYFSENQ